MLESDVRPPSPPRRNTHLTASVGGSFGPPAAFGTAAAVGPGKPRTRSPALDRPTWADVLSRRVQPGEPERPATDGAVLDVASTPSSVALVRRYCVDACSEFGWADSAATVELLVSELATNAIVHAGGLRVRVRVLDQGLRLRVEVSDDSPALPVPRRAVAGAENGRGLAMVSRLAVDAGCEVAVDGKTAWFEVGI